MTRRGVKHPLLTLVGLAALTVAQPPAVARDVPSPLCVLDHWVENGPRDNPYLVVVFRNDSPVPAVAWMIKIDMELADGTTATQRNATEVTPEGMADLDMGPIVSGQDRMERYALNPRSSAGAPIDVTVAVVATVFADNRTAGEPRALRLIAENRKTAASSWKMALEIVQSARQLAASPTGRLRSALDQIEERKGSDIVLNHVRMRLRMTLDRVEGNETAAEDQIDQLLEWCRKQRDAAIERLMPASLAPC